MAFSVRGFIFLIGIFLFILILELVRRKKFREELSIIWLFIPDYFQFFSDHYRSQARRDRM
jgi:hypothetical protein